MSEDPLIRGAIDLLQSHGYNVIHRDRIVDLHASAIIPNAVQICYAGDPADLMHDARLKLVRRLGTHAWKEGHIDWPQDTDKGDAIFLHAVLTIIRPEPKIERD